MTETQIIGRLIGAICRATGGHDEELPKIGALVVESSHSWRARAAWPEPSGVGWVVRIEPESAQHPLAPGNTRVVIRRLDDGTLQPWLNAMFYVAPDEFASEV